MAKDLAQVAAVCRSGYNQLQATRHSPDLSTHKDVTRKDAGPGVHFVSPGLLQLSVLRHHRRSDEPVAVCPECGCAFDVGRSTVRPHHTSAIQPTGGFWLPVRRRVDFKIATLVYLSLAWLQPVRPPTVSWSPTKVVVSCVLPHQGRLLSNGPTATIEKDILQLQVRSCETAFQLIWDKLTLINDFNCC